MECLINPSGGLPAVGDDRAGGSDLERVSVCLSQYCLLQLSTCSTKMQSLYLFLHFFSSRSEIYFYTEWVDYVAIHIGHDVSSHKEEIEDFINLFELILPSGKEKKKQLQLVQMDNTTVSRFATFTQTFLLRTLFQSYLE